MQKRIRSIGKKALSLLLIVLMLCGSCPYCPATAYAAMANLPAEMLDNVYLDALQYLGYDVAQLKADNKLFQSGYFGSGSYGTSGNLTNSKYWSGIDYDDNYVVSGLETSSGLPNLTRFKQYGLCCASFLTYFYFNYLPNVLGITTADSPGLATLREYCNKNTYSWAGAGKYGQAMLDMVADGKATKVATANNYDDLEIGDIVVWYSSKSQTNPTGFGHVAIYIGTDGTNYFVAHVGNYRGPEISTIEAMDKYANMVFRGGYRPTTPIIPSKDRGQIELTKKDSVTGAVLEGAVFQLIDADGNLIGDPAISDADGKVIFKDLELGTYTVVETHAPTGYDLPSPSAWTYTLDKNCAKVEDVYIVTDTILNVAQKGSVGVKKTDDIGTALSGVIFEVYSDSECTTSVGQMTTGADGKATLSGLAPGTYYIKEFSVPDGYIMNDTVYPATVTSNTTTYINDGNVVENIRKGKLTLIKKDDVGTLLGAGYVFGIYSDEACTIEVSEMTTLGDSVATSDYLAPGTYYVKEKSLPDTDTTHLINTDVFTVVVNPGETSQVNGGTVVNNLKKGTLALHKSDDAGTRIDGVKFSVYSNPECTKFVGKMTTDVNGYADLKDLTPGVYYVKETHTRDESYVLLTTVWTVTVLPGTKVYVANSYGNPIKNDRKGKLTLTKKDDAGALLGAGYVFGIYSDIACTKEVATMTTGDDSVATSGWLVAGTYYVKEKALPPDDDVHTLNTTVYAVTVNKGETSLVNAGSIINVRKTGTVKLVKTSEDGIVGNISFTIVGTATNGTSVNMTVTTNAEGVVEQELLIGTYTVTEINVSDRYIVPAAQEVTIEYDQTATVNFHNALKRGDLFVQKNSDDGHVSGLKFRLFGMSDAGIPVDLTATTDDSGIAAFTGVLKGSYTLQEVEVPIRYVTPANQSIQITYNGSINVSMSNILKKWEVTITKTDKTTGSTPQGNASLQGAVYGIYNSEGTLLDKYTTDANGKFTTKAYIAGVDYYLQEISPSPGYQLDTTKYSLNAYAHPENFTIALNAKAMTVTEQIILGKARITKHVYDSFANLRALESGAVFRYYLKSSGSYAAATIKGEFTTNTNGIATTPELPYGTYVVSQVSGAAGTDMIADFEVVISEHNKTYTYSKDNPLWMASLSINKNEAGTTTPLVAEFTLYDGDKAVEVRSTDKNGNLTFTTKLVYGKTYYVKESPLAGYLPNNTIYEFSCTEKNQAITRAVENVPAESSIFVKKTSSTGTPMAGVIVLLEYSMDNGTSWNPIKGRTDTDNTNAGFCDSLVLNSDGTITTDANGEIHFTGLRQDTQLSKIKYRVTELKTLNGYNLLPDHVWVGNLPTQIDGAEVGDLAISVVNGRGFELPATGENSEATFIIFGSFVTATGLLGLLTAWYIADERKKKSRKNFERI